MTCLVDIEGGKDLVPVTIFDAHKMTVIEFARACNEKVGKARNKGDKTHEKATQHSHIIPSFIMQPMLHILTYLSINLGIEVKAAGAVKDQFACAMVSNIGPLGIDCGFAPLCPPTRCSIIVCVGKV